MSIPLSAPFTAIVAGPSSSGKTRLTMEIVKHSKTVIVPPPDDIVWCYSIYQPEFNELKSVARLREGLPDPKTFDGARSSLVVLDDMMSECDARVTDLFTRVSHHRRVSVIFMSQNIFFCSKESRTISLNAHYLFLMKVTRDLLQIDTIARQMFPRDSKYMIEVYKDATREPFSYLLVDLKQQMPDKFRLCDGLLPGETRRKMK